MAHSFCAGIAIQELALVSPPQVVPTQTHVFDPKRLENLAACLQVCKACCDYFLAAGTCIVTAPAMLMFPYAIKVVYKLSTFKDTDWVGRARNLRLQVWN